MIAATPTAHDFPVLTLSVYSDGVIPRVTHQTGPTIGSHPGAGSLRDRLLGLHPAWQHRFYDDAGCREVVGREMPHLLPVYDNYRSPIQRVDLFRIVVMYSTGGFYLDTDIACHLSLDPLTAHGCVLGEERTLTDQEARALGHEHALRVANYMFGSVAKHPFWLDVLDAMAGEAGRPIERENDILESTGPGLLTRVYHRVKDRYPDLALVTNRNIRCPRCQTVCCQFGPFASHLHVGSWRWEHIIARTSPTRPAQQRIVVLKTYRENPCDGLTATFSRVHELGQLVEDSRNLAGQRVLVAGIPFLYVDKLSPANRNILYTMFESTVLPRHWVDAINAHYHACIVPHEHVRRVFFESGVRVPMGVSQLGYTRHPRSVPPRDGAFRVGFLGVPVRRKNLDKLFAACERLREALPSLRLAVHVSHYYDWMDRDTWNRIKAAPFVEWSEGVRSEQALADWFGRLSCYVYPSSGEGWSFTPREAMFLGIPTALTAIPVHQELIDSGFCAAIPTDGLEPAAFEGGVFGEWSRVRVEDIQRAIADIHDDAGRARERARLGAHWIEHRWGNAEMQRGLVDLIGQILPA